MTIAKPRPDRRLLALQAQTLPLPEAQDAFGFQVRLSESQWYRREMLEAYQLGHLKTLVRHAATAVPYYAGRLPVEAIQSATTLATACASTEGRINGDSPCSSANWACAARSCSSAAARSASLDTAGAAPSTG